MGRVTGVTVVTASIRCCRVDLNVVCCNSRTNFGKWLCKSLLVFATRQNIAYTPRTQIHMGTNCSVNSLIHSIVCWLVGCLTSQQHASVSQGPIYSDKFTCCHTEREVAHLTFYFTQSQNTDTGPTSLSADPIKSGQSLECQL